MPPHVRKYTCGGSTHVEKVESRHMCCIVCCRNTPDLQCRWRHLVLSGSYFYNSAARFTCKKQCFKLFRGFGAEGPQKLKAFYCISRLFFVYNQMYCGNTRLNNLESSRPNIDQITYFHSFITNATEMLTRPNDCLVLITVLDQGGPREPTKDRL